MSPVFGQGLATPLGVPQTNRGVVTARHKVLLTGMHVQRANTLHVPMVRRVAVRVHVPLLDDPDVVRGVDKVVRVREFHTIHRAIVSVQSLEGRQREIELKIVISVVVFKVSLVGGC